MKTLKRLLNLWIGLGSLAAFVGGWIFLSHSGKPVNTLNIPGNGAASTGNSASAVSDPSSGLAPLPTLAPLSSFNSSNVTSVQPVQPLQSQPSLNFAPAPRLRTRGS